MKMIVAIIRQEKLEEVQQALNSCDVYLMTVSDVRGCGRQRGFTEVYRGAEFQVRLLPKLKLEIAVNEAFVEAAVEAIVHAARTGDTGQIGDGKLLDNGKRAAFQVKEGDRVLFSSYAGNEVTVDGEEYLIMSEDDILAVVE